MDGNHYRLNEVYGVLALSTVAQAAMKVTLTAKIPAGTSPTAQAFELSALERDYTILHETGEVLDDASVAPLREDDGVMHYLFERAQAVKAADRTAWPGVPAGIAPGIHPAFCVEPADATDEFGNTIVRYEEISVGALLGSHIVPHLAHFHQAWFQNSIVASLFRSNLDFSDLSDVRMWKTFPTADLTSLYGRVWPYKFEMSTHVSECGVGSCNGSPATHHTSRKSDLGAERVFGLMESVYIDSGVRLFAKKNWDAAVVNIGLRGVSSLASAVPTCT